RAMLHPSPTPFLFTITPTPATSTLSLHDALPIFDGNGKFETQWNNLHRPNGMCMATGPDPLVYIGEGGPAGEINRDWPNIGPRVSIHTSKGKVLARLGKMHAGLAPGQFTSPHGIAVDERGNIYVGELSARVWGRLSKEPPPQRLRVIH